MRFGGYLYHLWFGSLLISCSRGKYSLRMSCKQGIWVQMKVATCVRIALRKHLYTYCSCARWRYKFGVRYRLMAPAQSLTDIWVKSRDNVRRLGDHCYKEWQALFMCACWHMWKRRNETIFSGTTTPTRLLAERIIQDGRLWLKYYNIGARCLMGTNLIADPN